MHKCNLCINAAFVEIKCNFLTFLVEQKLALLIRNSHVLQTGLYYVSNLGLFIQNISDFGLLIQNIHLHAFVVTYICLGQTSPFSTQKLDRLLNLFKPVFLITPPVINWLKAIVLSPHLRLT
uniref:Heme-binding protein 2-like n=1 Tax=Phallusia mammillata TaxID=59560 RepID=A0A6F9DEC7_9ASCI|nr:heme-binding protein 2-like [Phallusia mammillata]